MTEQCAQSHGEGQGFRASEGRRGGGQRYEMGEERVVGRTIRRTSGRVKGTMGLQGGGIRERHSEEFEEVKGK